MSDAAVRPFSIQALLEDSTRYVIPMYQRNYAWGEGEITQLLQDVTDYQSKKNSEGKHQTYYIGTLVVFARCDGTFEVIDGQQRFTTLSLLAIWLKNQKNGAVDMSWYGVLNLDFESRPISSHTFTRLWKKDEPYSLRGNTFNEGLVNGFELIGKALSALGLVGTKLMTFCEYLFKNVQISRIEVPKDTDLNHFFEAMNNRGEQLEKHEVVKARLMEVLNQIPESLIRKFFSTDNALRFCGSACGLRRSKSTLLTRLWTFPSLWRAACSDRARRMFVRPPSGEAGFQSPWLCLIA